MVIAFVLRKPTQFDVPFFRYVAALPAGSHRLEVIYLEAPDQSHHDLDTGATTAWGIDLTGGYSWHCLGPQATKVGAMQLLRQLGADRVIVNGYKEAYVSWVQAAIQLSLPLDLRIDSVLFGKNRVGLLLRKFFMRLRYRAFQRFLTTGSIGRQYLRYIGIREAQIGWFPYCTDNDFFARHHNGEGIATLQQKLVPQLAGRQVILAVCKFIPRENPVELMEAFLRLNDPSLLLILIGDGPLKAKLQQMAAASPQLHILLPGYIRYTGLPAWYGIARLFVHPARNEPWGVSVQEAIAAGSAVVCSDKVGSGFDLVEPGANGYRYPAGNSVALTNVLRQALQLPSATIRQTNQRLLQQWNYARVWESLTANA